MWFHISEHTPETGSTVVVMVGSQMFVCEYDEGMFYDSTTDDIFMEDEVDFWVQIPEPPEPMEELEPEPPPESGDEYHIYYSIVENLFCSPTEFYSVYLN